MRWATGIRRRRPACGRLWPLWRRRSSLFSIGTKRQRGHCGRSSGCAPFYVESIFENVPTQGHVQLDPDTAMRSGFGRSGVAIRRRHLRGGRRRRQWRARNAFCAVRPPGHHAESSAAMGFCFFNNAAIAAEHARAAHGMERVAIVDFDVHHGNGSQITPIVTVTCSTLRATSGLAIQVLEWSTKPACSTTSSTCR